MPFALAPLMHIFAPLNSEPQPNLQRIEIASSFHIPGFHIVGLPSPEVSEAKERIRAALESCGFELPKRRVVLNLAPASIRKSGTGLDLAMALSVLSLDLPEDLTASPIAAWGEVSLDGSIKPAGQMTRSVFAAWQGGLSHLFISTDEEESGRTALHIIGKAGFFSTPAPQLVPVGNLNEAWDAMQSRDSFSFEKRNDSEPRPSLELAVSDTLLPLSPSLERAICVAAIGGHHLLLLGPKGTGKSHALEWLIALQPEISARMKTDHLLLSELSQTQRGIEPRGFNSPVRRVSAGARPPALIGSLGAGLLRPGEFSLAHGGILVADEFPEWSRDSREALREPLERGVITLTRARHSIEFPARFSFAANGNLCPCGGWPAEFPIPLEVEKQKKKLPKCRCTHTQRKLYFGRMSGPVLDRMDLVLLVGGTSVHKIDEKTSQRFRKLKTQIELARSRAIEFWKAAPGCLSATEIERLLDENPTWKSALDQLQLSSLRARHKTVRVALSLSVWDGTPGPQPAHFMEASCYRPERFGLCD
jgi:magnesium chelatase family protein